MDKRTKKNIINKAIDGKGGNEDYLKGVSGIGKPGLFGKQDYIAGALKLKKPKIGTKIVNSLFRIPNRISEEKEKVVGEITKTDAESGATLDDRYSTKLKKYGISNKEIKDTKKRMKENIIKELLKKQNKPLSEDGKGGCKTK